MKATRIVAGPNTPAHPATEGPGDVRDAGAKSVGRGLLPPAGPDDSRRLFRINFGAEYVIADGSSLEAIGSDIGCLLEAAEGALAVLDGPENGAYWAAVYTLRQAHGAFNAYQQAVAALPGYLTTEGGAA